jgi:hypothetical protein
MAFSDSHFVRNGADCQGLPLLPAVCVRESGHSLRGRLHVLLRLCHPGLGISSGGHA